MALRDLDARERARSTWRCDHEEDRIPIWLDCDTGHDDAFAILLAATCPRLKLLGVSTVHGNASLENTTKNTMSILKVIGRKDVPVHPGAAKPFCREAVHAESIHGETGLDGTTLLPIPPDLPAELRNIAIDAMYTVLSAQPPEKAWLVSTGALTNIALLFAVHPYLAQHIRGLSVMGGAVGGFFSHAPLGRLRERIPLSSTLYRAFPAGLPDDSEISLPEVAAQFRALGLLTDAANPKEERVQLFLNEARQSFGNWTPYAEFNIYVDPEAASSVFSNPLLASKTTLIPLDVTHQVLATPPVMAMVKGGANGQDPSKLRSLFHEILTFFAATYASEFGMTDGPPLHDPLAVAAALREAMFDDNDGERYDVYVVKEGDQSLVDRRRNLDVASVGQCGRTIARMLEKGKEGIRIPRTLKIEEFWCLIDLALQDAESRGGMN